MSYSHAYAIEVQGTAAGIVVAERSGFQFFAADDRFAPLDGRVFRRVDQAERAARALGERPAAAESGTGIRRATGAGE